MLSPNQVHAINSGEAESVVLPKASEDVTPLISTNTPMSSHPIQPSFRERGREFIRLCNEKITWAARDLAEFTKNGIHAGFIVSLAHKCEDLEKSLDEEGVTRRLMNEGDVASEVWQSVTELCEKGRDIFQHNPSKYNDYLLDSVDDQAASWPKTG